LRFITGRKKEEGRRKKEEGRRKKEEGKRRRNFFTRACFLAYQIDVGAKHSGDKFLLKTSILYPNASP
jgi:hypothetical protein